MDKKGDERQLLWIFYAVIAVAVLMAAMAFVSSVTGKSRLDEEYYAREIAYLVDLVEAGNGDVKVNYVITENSYDFFIGRKDGDHKVIVGPSLDAKGEGKESKSYEYNSLAEFGYFEKPQELVIKKKDGRISINEVGARIIVKLGEFLSNVVSNDRYGEYLWIVSSLDDNSLIVRKKYINTNQEFIEESKKTSNEINRLVGKYDSFVILASEKYGIDKNLINAVIRKESTGNPEALSPQGARGLMQLLPTTASDMAGRTITDEELKNPELNIDLGTKYLDVLLKKFEGDLELALAAYNRGMNFIDSNCMKSFSTCDSRKTPKETKDYVVKSLNYYYSLEAAEKGTITDKLGESRQLMYETAVRLDENNYLKISQSDISGGLYVEEA